MQLEYHLALNFQVMAAIIFLRIIYLVCQFLYLLAKIFHLDIVKFIIFYYDFLAICFSKIRILISDYYFKALLFK